MDRGDSISCCTFRLNSCGPEAHVSRARAGPVQRHKCSNVAAALVDGTHNNTRTPLSAATTTRDTNGRAGAERRVCGVCARPGPCSQRQPEWTAAGAHGQRALRKPLTSRRVRMARPSVSRIAYNGHFSWCHALQTVVRPVSCVHTWQVSVCAHARAQVPRAHEQASKTRARRAAALASDPLCR